MTKQDSHTNWFHELALHQHDELLALASPENIVRLQMHAAISTPEYPLPKLLSAGEFAEAVIEFSRNETSWNRATMDAITKADDLFNTGCKAEAAETLEAFAASCPWALFKEVAIDQAAHYR